jgi:siroheme synthase (precorrin-2 oxidase/ferrochelatase)
VVKAAEGRSPELGVRYRDRIEKMLTQPEHQWLKGLSPEEADALRKEYEKRYSR